MLSSQQFSQKLLNIKKDIATSAPDVQRPLKCELICVTKTVEEPVMAELLKCGVFHFAENRVDVLLRKKHYFSSDKITWHFIGRLQRRKVKSLINEIDYFHALDSLELAAEIDKRAQHEIKCFVQVNVSGESTKQGILIDEAESFIKALSIYPNIKIVGLMTMAPFQEKVSKLHNYFATLRQLRDVISNHQWEHAPCTELSMGMSQDYKIAVAEGATMIRIGTAIFE